MAKPIVATNDFVVKFANVNGSGSASANGLFAKIVLRMGVPVGARNIFPSNIQGLPTWYEVRINEADFLGRRCIGRQQGGQSGQDGWRSLRVQAIFERLDPRCRRWRAQAEDGVADGPPMLVGMGAVDDLDDFGPRPAQEARRESA